MRFMSPLQIKRTFYVGVYSDSCFNTWKNAKPFILIIFVLWQGEANTLRISCVLVVAWTKNLFAINKPLISELIYKMWAVAHNCRLSCACLQGKNYICYADLVLKSKQTSIQSAIKMNSFTATDKGCTLNRKIHLLLK